MKAGSKSFWKASSGIAGLLALMAILSAANALLATVSLRADLTEEQLYTLSQGSRSLLKKLEHPVTLKLFFNRTLPEVPVYLKNYARQVEDLLKEYEIAAGGKILIEKYDPQPDSDAEEWAQRYGLSGQALGLFGPPVYFGLVAVAGDIEGSIPWLDPRTENLLEYNITRLIYRTTHPEKPAIGLISSLPVMGSGAPPFGMPPSPAPNQPAWLAFQDLRDDYTIRELSSGEEQIPADLELLLVVHPKELPEQTLYALDQFVLRGGRLLAFLDPLSVADLESARDAAPFGRQNTSSSLGKLLNAWGVKFDPGKVTADRRAATRLRAANNQVEDNPAFLTLGPDNISREDVVTAQLGSLMLPFAGSLSCESSGDVAVTPLIRSSVMAGTTDAMTAQFGEAAMRREFKPEPVALNLAVRLTGKLKTAFPDGKPPKQSEAKEPADEPAADEAAPLQEGNGTVVLVADVDMLYNRFCVEELDFLGFKAHRPLNDNVNFLANTLEQLAGSSDLIGIRSRGSFDRPFDRVLALEEQARKEWQAREESLVSKLQETRQQLSQLQGQKAENQQFILSHEQKQAIARFKQEELRINRELKDVRKNLRADIERLGARVKFINIALMPLCVSVAGVVFGIYRRKKQ